MAGFRNVMTSLKVCPIISTVDDKRYGSRTLIDDKIAAELRCLKVDASPLFAAITLWSSSGDKCKPAESCMRYHESGVLRRASAVSAEEVAVVRDIIKFYLRLNPVNHPLMTKELVNLAGRHAALKASAECLLLFLDDTRMDPLPLDSHCSVQAFERAVRDSDVATAVRLVNTRKLPSLKGYLVYDIGRGSHFFKALKETGRIDVDDPRWADVAVTTGNNIVKSKSPGKKSQSLEAKLAIATEKKDCNAVEQIIRENWEVISFDAAVDSGSQCHLFPLVMTLIQASDATKASFDMTDDVVAACSCRCQISAAVDLTQSCRWGLTWRVRQLLTTNPGLKVSPEDVRLAVEGKHKAIVTIIMDSGRVTVDDGCHKLLSAVMYSGDEEMVKLVMGPWLSEIGQNQLNILFNHGVMLGKLQTVKALVNAGRRHNEYVKAAPRAGKMIFLNFDGALSTASYYDKSEIVAYFLSLPGVTSGPNVRTALEQAVLANNVDMARLLLRTGKAQAESSDNILLRVACSCGQTGMVRLLLSSNAVATGPGKSRALLGAANGGHAEVVKMLVKTKKMTGHAAALLRAAEAGHADVVRTLIKETKSNPTARNHLAFRESGRFHGRGDSAMRVFMQHDKIPVATRLQALRSAAHYGNVACVRLLLADLAGESQTVNVGVSVEQADQGEDVEGDATVSDRDRKAEATGARKGVKEVITLESTCEAIVIDAAMASKFEIIEAVLDSVHLVTDILDRAVCLAAHRGNYSLLRRLLPRPDVRLALKGNNPIKEAIHSWKEEAVKARIVELLIDCGCVDVLDQSFVKIAIERGQAEVVEAIVKGGLLNPDPRGKEYKEAMSCALKSKSYRVAKYLVEGWGGEFEGWAWTNLAEVRDELVYFAI
ncbi:hypothetical protein HK101_006832 [Irineochytrium annulatum]|nr:hypothetical protein HK101_006832 [Irineochytrium annulatum]